jgi:hypothetical protein
MSPDDAHTDSNPPPKDQRARVKPAQEAGTPSSSPCLLSTDEQDIDPDYLPDYSRKSPPGHAQGAK